MDKQVNLAPVGLSTYARLDHLKQTVEALQRNQLAPESLLYIFSDGPRDGDEEKVQRLRNYLKMISGFRAIEIVERASNNRVQNNRGGIKYMAEKYGKFIFVEEDCVVAPDFLGFMNRMLDFYQHDQRVFSISGWSPPITMPKNYNCDVYLATSFSSWTFGMWADRFFSSNYNGISEENWRLFKRDRNAQRFLASNGRHVLPMVKADLEGKINALDVRFCFHQAINHLYSVYPRSSLTINIGLDGSGEHCGEAREYFNNDLTESVSLLPCANLLPNDEIQRRYKRFSNGIERAWQLRRMGSIYRRIIKKLLRKR